VSAYPYATFYVRVRERGLLGGLLALCKEKHATLEDVFSPSRTKSVAAARHAVFAWLVLEKGMSRVEVAILFGRDVSTVHHGVKRHAASVAA
jgi:chromosomal replication initiation ATPase DnaA